MTLRDLRSVLELTLVKSYLELDMPRSQYYRLENVEFSQYERESDLAMMHKISEMYHIPIEILKAPVFETLEKGATY